MGYEILYCKICQSQVRGADLEKGLAIKAEGYAYCPTCARSLPQQPPATPPPTPSGRRPGPRRSTDRIPVPPPPRAAPRARSPLPLVLGLCAAGAGLLILLGLAFSSSGSPAPVAVPAPPPPRAADPPPSRPKPVEGPTGAQVLAELERAAAAADADLTDLLFRCDQARKQLKGTPEEPRLVAIEERAKAKLKENAGGRQVDAVLEEVARLRKDDPRFRRRGDTIALIESARKLAGSRMSELDRLLADYLKDADAYKSEADGLAAWYRFDTRETLGMDAGSFERHGKAGGAGWVAEDGPRKGVLRLEGQAELLLPVAAREDFSIAFWVRTKAVSRAGEQWFIGMGIVDAEMPGKTSDFGVALLEGRIAFGIGGDPDTTLRSTSSVIDDLWRHVAVTYRSGDGVMRIYVNGAKESEGRGATGTRSAPDQIAVGRLRTGTGRFEGSLDDLRFYSRALEDVDIRRLAAK